MPTILLVCT
jgi:hypothetical protein